MTLFIACVLQTYVFPSTANFFAFSHLLMDGLTKSFSKISFVVLYLGGLYFSYDSLKTYAISSISRTIPSNSNVLN